MENEKKCFVHIENYTGEKPIEIIYREDNAKQVLEPIPARLPKSFHIEGTIGAPAEWLRKNKALVDEHNATVYVGRDMGMIKLVLNERDCLEAIESADAKIISRTIAARSTVIGTIQMTDTYKKLHVNDDAFWSTAKLAKHLRLNRSIFVKAEEGMQLVTQLKNVKAKISGDYDKKTELHGQISKITYMSQEVEHNIMPRFAVKTAIFKGQPEEVYDIEIDADIIEGEIMVQLLSPAVNDRVERARSEMIDKELGEIGQICPGIPVIEI